MFTLQENSKWSLADFYTASVEWPLVWGVYAIINELNGKMYIGSTAGVRGIRGRIRQHFNNLNRGKHTSTHLQRAFNKCGIGVFSVSILKITSRENALVEEQRLLDATQVYLPRNGYNTQRFACAKPVIRPIRELRTHAEAQAKPFRVMFQGEIFEGRNLKAFCKSRGLNDSSLGQVLKGVRKSHRGWTRPETPKTSYTLMAPDGTVHAVTHLTNFAVEHGLNRQCINRLVLGQRETHAGWRLAFGEGFGQNTAQTGKF